MKPKAVRPRGLGLGYKTGANGYSGVSASLTKISTAKTALVESVVINDNLADLTQTITETAECTVT